MLLTVANLREIILVFKHIKSVGPSKYRLCIMYTSQYTLNFMHMEFYINRKEEQNKVLPQRIDLESAVMN